MKPVTPPLKHTSTAHNRRPETQASTGDLLETLPTLIALWPGQVDVSSHASRTTLLKILMAALRKERARGLSGHWAYDLARHVQLLKAFRHIKNIDATHLKQTQIRTAQPNCAVPKTKNTPRDNND